MKPEHKNTKIIQDITTYSHMHASKHHCYQHKVSVLLTSAPLGMRLGDHWAAHWGCDVMRWGTYRRDVALRHDLQSLMLHLNGEFLALRVTGHVHLCQGR